MNKLSTQKWKKLKIKVKLAKLPREFKDTEKRYLSATQIGIVCGLSQSSVFRAMKDGKIRTVRTPGGHYRAERLDIIKFIEKMGITPGKMTLDLIAGL